MDLPNAINLPFGDDFYYPSSHGKSKSVGWPRFIQICIWIKIGYTLVNIQQAIENSPVEIVDLLIKHGDLP